MKKFVLVAVMAILSAVSAADFWNCDFKKGVSGWQCPPYWSGKIRLENGALKFLPADKGGKSWARAYKIYNVAKNLPDKILEISAALNGKGKARLGAIVYTRDFQGKTEINYVWGPEFSLTGEKTVYKYNIDLTDLKPFQLGLCVEVIGKGVSAFCHEVRLRDVTKENRVDTVYLSAQPDKKLYLGPIVYSQTFDTGAANWQSPPYWSGKLNWKKEGCLKLVSVKKGPRVYGGMYQTMQNPGLLAGAIFEYSAYVKGEGKFKLGVIAYGRNAKNQLTYPILWSQETQLDKMWRKVKFVVDFSKAAPWRAALRMELTTKGEVFVDNVVVKKLYDPFMTVEAQPGYAAVCKDKALPKLAFRISDKTAVPVLFTPCDPATPAGVEVKCDANGKIRLTDAQIGKGKYIYLAARGNAAAIRLEEMSKEKYEKLDKAAKQVRCGKEKNILIIGDSLLDKNFSLNRDRGAVKQLDFWLNLHNDGQFTIRNAAVRGDCIKRVWSRMCYELKTSKSPVFSQDVYKDLFKFPADIIFVQLGHNDTSTTSKRNFAAPSVLPAEQKELYRKMLAQFRKVWPKSRIVLVSNTSSNYVLTKQKADAALKKNPSRIVGLYGLPKFMEQYNAVLRSVAPEFKAEFYDIYTPMKALPQAEKAKLLNPYDGVHLSDAGQEYQMLQYLKYMAALK